MELALARLMRWAPELRVWGLSATLGNLEEARDTLLRPLMNREAAAIGCGEPAGQIVQGAVRRETEIESVLPPEIERFPWAGHLGLRSSAGHSGDRAESLLAGVHEYAFTV